MIDPGQFKAHVVRPSLQRLARLTGIVLGPPVVETLLLGTALQESALTYLVELGDSSGRGGHGPYQDEPQDIADLYSNFLDYRPALRDVIDSYRRPNVSLAEQIERDFELATVLCRLHYWRAQSPLPPAEVSALAAYYKTWYNTPLGAAEPDDVQACMARALATP